MSLVSKLKEPSTVRGIITLLGLFGYGFNKELAEPIAVAVGAALSIVEIIRREGISEIK